MELMCNLQRGDAHLAIPKSHDMNSIYLYSQYSDIKKDIDTYLEKNIPVSAYTNKDILSYLNKIILSKILPEPSKFELNLEDIKRLNTHKGLYIPKFISNLNDFDRIAGFSGLNSSMFSEKDLNRLEYMEIN